MQTLDRCLLSMIQPVGSVGTNIWSDRGTWPCDIAATYFGKVRMPCDGGHMSGIRLANMCGMFTPGHVPHWIQMSRATEDRENSPKPCRFVEVRQDGTIVIEVVSQELYLWNHEPDRLAEVAARTGRGIEFQSRWGLLWLPSGSGRHAFSVTRSLSNHVPCPSKPQVGSLDELLRDAGGFTVFANEL